MDNQKQKELLQKFFYAGLQAVAPDGAVLRHLRLEKNPDEHGNGDTLWVKDQPYPLKGKKIILLGAGKGVAPMAQAMEELLGEHIHDGLVVAKYDHGLPLRYIKLLEAAHPVPDIAGVQATSALLEKAREANHEHLVICLFTGGASALTPAPVQGLSLEDIQKTTSAFLACGATIYEINAVRKHLSVFSGGQLAREAQPAQVLSLIISDVIGDTLDVIASGPTVPDASTFQDCLTLCKKYTLEGKIPSTVACYLQENAHVHSAETPKAGDNFFQNVRNELIATNEEAINAIAEHAEDCVHDTAPQGFDVFVLDVPMQGEAKEVALTLISLAKEMHAGLCAHNKPLCLIAGGETTVNVHGTGTGGRNQEMALTAALALEDCQGIYALFAGTDGSDGPTDAAGGFAHARSAHLMRQHCEPQNMLDNNDSYTALTASGDIFITGPTRTNVMDIALLLVYPKDLV